MLGETEVVKVVVIRKQNKKVGKFGAEDRKFLL